MEGVKVTEVTEVTNGDLSPCHAPRDGDSGGDRWGPP
jgi:hypothetical protein